MHIYKCIWLSVFIWLRGDGSCCHPQNKFHQRRPTARSNGKMSKHRIDTAGGDGGGGVDDVGDGVQICGGKQSARVH